VNAEERAERQYVIDRDGECVLVKRDPDHVCRRLGFPHRSSTKRFLTVEHVKDQPMMGKRAPSNRWHMVAMCWDGNVAVQSKVVREWIREYIRRVEPRTTSSSE
jgi:hypothetical protein